MLEMIKFLIKVDYYSVVTVNMNGFIPKNTIPIDDNIDELSNDELTQESFGILDEEEDQMMK